jgi:crotonobetainyl-CoA:carnitine CoA-transferase CaiB-like acyl-CoA transferase
VRVDRKAASKSATPTDVISDQLLWEREFYRFVTDRREGQRLVLGPSWRLSRAPAQIARGAPDLGEDDDYVPHEILSAGGSPDAPQPAGERR